MKPIRDPGFQSGYFQVHVKMGRAPHHAAGWPSLRPILPLQIWKFPFLSIRKEHCTSGDRRPGNDVNGYAQPRDIPDWQSPSAEYDAGAGKKDFVLPRESTDGRWL